MGLVCGKCSVQIPNGILAILTEGFRDYPQSFQEDPWGVCRICHGRFQQSVFLQFVIIQQPYLATIYRLYTDKASLYNRKKKSKPKDFFYSPSLFAICTKYNKQMGRNRNKRGGRVLSSAHPYVGGARPGMVTRRSYKLNLRTRINTTTIMMRSG
jgi:hypothetical protein